MTEEAKGQETKQPDQSGKIELDSDVYSALLDRLDELEASNAGRSKDKQDEGEDLDSLARQAQPQPTGQPGKQIDLERLNNQGLATYIARELTSDVINPMLVKLSQIELRLEEKELSGQYEDFKDVKKDTYALLHKNPSLSLEQAYHLAKTQQAKSDKPKTKTDDEPATAKKGSLRHLPPRPVSHGEKPSGAATGATHPATTYKTNRSAAERAIEDLQIDFPVKGGNI
jgi:hypothetical protein